MLIRSSSHAMTKPTMRSFLQFGVLSGGGWLLDCALLLLLSQNLGVSLSVANVVSSSVAAVSVFTVSRLFIFHPAVKRQILRTVMYACYTFGVIAAVSVVIEPVAWWANRAAHYLSFVPTTGQLSFIAKVLVTPPQLIANFFMARFLAQRKI